MLKIQNVSNLITIKSESRNTLHAAGGVSIRGPAEDILIIQKKKVCLNSKATNQLIVNQFCSFALGFSVFDEEK